MAAMLATEIGAYEDDTRLQGFDVESDLPRFLDSVLQRTDQISQTMDEEIVEQHIVVVDETVRLLRILRDSGSNINASDKETLDNLSSAFSDVQSMFSQSSRVSHHSGEECLSQA